jgi:uncharacterized MnhB-related membrane protein
MDYVIGFAWIFVFIGALGWLEGAPEVAFVCALLGPVVVGAFFMQWRARRARKVG